MEDTAPHSLDLSTLAQTGDDGEILPNFKDTITWLSTSNTWETGAVGPVVMPFVEVIGQDLTARMLTKLGGSAVYFPRKVTNSTSLLASVVGVPAAKALGAALGTGTIRLPIGNLFLCRYYRAQGMPVEEIARTIRLSDTHVRRNLDKA